MALLYPEEDEEKLTQMTETYVSLPSTDRTKPSPHATGGAIDLSIIKEDGTFLDMGTEWDNFDINSRTSHFRNKNSIVHQNRALLYGVMSKVGFTNYPEEWWHYDFGNQFWGHILNRTAIYGMVQGGDIYDGKK